MLASLIRWSIQNRFLVLMATGVLAVWGIHATLSTPLDALPDLSEDDHHPLRGYPEP